MNNFIINGFSFSQRKNDVKSLNTQKMVKVSKNFYNFLKEVNEHKTKISDSEFKSLKRESGTIASPQTIVTDFEDEKWKRSFMKHLCQTNSRLSEKEFYLFKERLHKDEKNKSEKKAKKFAKLIFSIDSEEYNNKQITGKGGKVNFGNLNRKIRLYNIMKTGDDEEREGAEENEERREARRFADKGIRIARTMSLVTEFKLFMEMLQDLAVFGQVLAGLIIFTIGVRTSEAIAFQFKHFCEVAPGYWGLQRINVSAPEARESVAGGKSHNAIRLLWVPKFLAKIILERREYLLTLYPPLCL